VRTVLRAADRFVDDQPGIRSWHCFAAGPHYDPRRLSFGALIGVDEHVLAPGAEFAQHAHRGVAIVSWVIAGVLRHTDEGGTIEVPAGQVLVQRCGSGVRHSEANPSGDEPLRFVQVTVLDGHDAPAAVTAWPVRVGETAEVTLLDSGRHRVQGQRFGYVLTGQWHLVDGSAATQLGPGDALQWPGPSVAPQAAGWLAGEGSLLAVTLG
jgi:quercetin dioxygenase-like cupin family protein